VHLDDGTSFEGIVHKVMLGAESDSDRLLEVSAYIDSTDNRLCIKVEDENVTGTIAPAHMNDGRGVVSIEGAIIPMREYKVTLDGPAFGKKTVVAKSGNHAKKIATEEKNENSSFIWSARDVKLSDNAEEVQS